MKEYAAPWGKLLVATTAFSVVICVGVSVAMSLTTPHDSSVTWIMRGAALLPMIVLVAALPFMVRGYAVTADEILVRRLFWSTRFERARLQLATVDPEALRGSIRLMGNGGLFSFTGLFRSSKLGRYRAYVTDPLRCVILRFADRVVVVSPGDQEAFVRDVMSRR